MPRSSHVLSRSWHCIVGVQAYSFVIPPAGSDMHLQFKLRRWGIAILLSAPESIAGGWMHVEETLCQRHPPDLEQAYVWEFVCSGRIRGVGDRTFTEQQSIVLLDQESNGIHWSIAGDNIADQRAAADCRTLLGTKSHGTLSCMRICCFTSFHGVPRTLSRTNTSSTRLRHNRFDGLNTHAARSLRH